MLRIVVHVKVRFFLTFCIGDTWNPQSDVLITWSEQISTRSGNGQFLLITMTEKEIK